MAERAKALISIAQLIHVDPAKAEVCVERLAEIFRYLLNRAEQEFVITGLDTPSLVPRDGYSTSEVPTVPGPMFTDIVLRETVVQAASLAAGLRRALAPEVRNRIRFEMRREVKRARKQRRADQRR